jgi:hypothetical protein
MAKQKTLDEQVSDVIDDLDYNSTVLGGIREMCHNLQEEVDLLRLSNNDLEKQNKKLEKDNEKLRKKVN